MGDIQESNYREWNLGMEWNGTVWARMVVRNFLLCFETLWEARNKEVHPSQESRQISHLKEKIRKILNKNMRVPNVLKSVYKKGEVLLKEANPSEHKIQRWVSIMDDVSEYEKQQEPYDRTLGRDLREFSDTDDVVVEKGSRGKKRKRVVYEGGHKQPLAAVHESIWGSIRKKRKLNND